MVAPMLVRLGAIVLLALTAPTAPALAQPSGEAIYAEDCASCHRTPGRVMRRFLEKPAAEREAALDRFLAEHHAPDQARRRSLVAWLLASERR
jgi:mono/diheme cytochrome c family protein